MRFVWEIIYSFLHWIYNGWTRKKSVIDIRSSELDILLIEHWPIHKKLYIHFFITYFNSWTRKKCHMFLDPRKWTLYIWIHSSPIWEITYSFLRQSNLATKLKWKCSRIHCPWNGDFYFHLKSMQEIIYSSFTQWWRYSMSRINFWFSKCFIMRIQC